MSREKVNGRNINNCRDPEGSEFDKAMNQPYLFVVVSLELDNFRDMNWVPMNAIRPWSIFWCFDGSVALPYCTVALESTSKSYLPNPVPFFHPPLCLNVAHLVPQR